jgi:hypothetical protein
MPCGREGLIWPNRPFGVSRDQCADRSDLIAARRAAKFAQMGRKQARSLDVALAICLKPGENLRPAFMTES